MLLATFEISASKISVISFFEKYYIFIVHFLSEDYVEVQFRLDVKIYIISKFYLYHYNSKSDTKFLRKKKCQS